VGIHYPETDSFTGIVVKRGRSMIEGQRRARIVLLWMGAAGLSLILNAGLLSLMPAMIRAVPFKAESSLAPTPPHTVTVKLKGPSRPPSAPPGNEEKKGRPVEKAAPKPVLPLPRQGGNPPVKTPQLAFPAPPPLPTGSLKPPTPALESPGLQMAAVEKGDLQGPGLKSAYEMGEIDGPLTPVSQPRPPYPLRARRMGVEGWVRVQFLVTEQGTVEGVRVVDAEPAGVFEGSVLQCVASWRFTPGTVAGVPVKTRVGTTIRFQLD